jgi:hypothetical protein
MEIVMNSQERVIDEYISTYLSARAADRLVVSTHETIRAIRNAFPACDMSDRALADRIATQALELGCPVSFDSDKPAREAMLAGSEQISG